MTFAAIDFLKDVDVHLSVELGRTEMPLNRVMALAQDEVIVLDRMTDELLDLRVNGKIVAKGEVIAHNGRFGIRIVEMAGNESAARPSVQPLVGKPVGSGAIVE